LTPQVFLLVKARPRTAGLSFPAASVVSRELVNAAIEEAKVSPVSRLRWRCWL